MTPKKRRPDEVRDRVSKRLNYHIVAEPESENEPGRHRLTTDVVDWFMLRAPHTRFELCCLRMAIVRAMAEGKGQAGDFVVYSGGGTAVICNSRSALLLLGYERIQELLAYLDYEREQCSSNSLDNHALDWLNAIKAPPTNTPSSKRKVKKATQESAPSAT